VVLLAVKAKKVSKKKKIVKKKAVRKSAKKKSLQRVSSEVRFCFVDGTECHDLLSLSETICHADNDIFKHHVRDDNNDFANWVEFVFNEAKLARKLRKSKDKNKHVVEILRFIIDDLK
jgi:hypothetical protein|tara:strand:- start:1002 stop:1355 length:354 start_codon:yes stop_codon:yes gene_type:complete